MYYQQEVTVPANTTEAACTRTTLKLTKGLITGVYIFLPPGSCGLLHFQAYDKGWTIVPFNPTEDIHGDNIDILLHYNYPLVEEPFEIVVRAWNDDDSYEHSYIMGFEMTEGEVDTSMLDFLKKLKEAM